MLGELYGGQRNLEGQTRNQVRGISEDLVALNIGDEKERENGKRSVT